MPGRDGVELITRVSKAAPDTERLLLTGHADLDVALGAVNQGHVFRILTKPCPPEDLRAAVEAAVRQHGLVLASRELFALKRFQGLLEGVVQGFSSLVEARDPYLAGHHQRTTDLACAIARELHMDAAERDTLRIAALLHDIGKVYVPADFLSRPGLLRTEEFSIVKMHPEVGYDILKHLDRDWPVAVIIRQHHERLDGSGYPQGLTGRYIVLGARILAVADVVDAMCSHRPYRPSLGIKAALEELEAGRNRLFDPLAVDACLDLFRNKGYSLAEPANKA
jgi:putative two-component system response regulator